MVKTFNKDFRDTKIGRIPKEWEVVKLGDEEVAGLIMGQSPPSSTYNNTGIGLPFFQGNAEFGEMYPTPVLSCSHPIKITEENDILLSVRAPVGDVNIAPFKSCIGRGLAAIRPKGDKFDYLFLFYYLKLESRLFESLSMGSTFKAIRKIEIEKFRVLLPPLPEQKKIAEILSTVDEAIEKVDEAIAKTERLKKGLMRGLLTKGMGHKDFKDTEIGRIPKEWKVVRLKEVADINKESQDPHREFPEKKFLYIDIDSIENETGAIRGAKTIIGREAPLRARRLIHYSDVIMSTVRPYLKAFAIVPREYDAQICSTGFAVLSCKERILPSYLLYMLFSNSVIAQCKRIMVGAQYPALNKSQVEEIKVPLPHLPEQKKIAEILSTVDKRLELLRRQKGKLGRIKKGLMNDLLTGKKRVGLET
ncbi:MAG: restriction endonuclease subunit S [Candidatus Cloacimonadota bacterium]|nr:MAG: restriction endonuclease subunit S [Candidatus Cloacimonadota bacterium]